MMPPHRSLTHLLLLLLLAVVLVMHVTCARTGVGGASNSLLRDIERFKRTLASGANAASSYNLATALLSLGNNSAALPHLFDAVVDPSFPGRHGAPQLPRRPCLATALTQRADALMNAGVCFERLGMARDCARAYRASMRMKPGLVAALNLLSGARALDPSPHGAM
jgi:hypothetical protein